MDHPIWSALFILLFLTSPLVVFLFCFLRTRRKLPREEGKKPIYQTTCSVRIDGPIYNFVRITLYDEILVLVTLLRRFIIPVSAIASVQKPPHKFSELLIDPFDSNQYPFIVMDSAESQEMHDHLLPMIENGTMA